MFYSLNCLLKLGVLSIEVVAGALALYRGVLYELISVYVVEVDRPVGSINRKLTKIALRNEMLIFVGCHVISLKFQMKPNGLAQSRGCCGGCGRSLDSVGACRILSLLML